MVLIDPKGLFLGLSLADHTFLNGIWAKETEYLLLCGH